ncbi:2526_t:CDS:2 [Entrophospora sp. SA101]|nr:6169_t:CDS:2 [Entrophospora sp. SA101]CAJ0825633.1 2526_t:CDS:2 [Entrophospora sp. SA101]
MRITHLRLQHGKFSVNKDNNNSRTTTQLKITVITIIENFIIPMALKKLLLQPQPFKTVTKTLGSLSSRPSTTTIGTNSFLKKQMSKRIELLEQKHENLAANRQNYEKELVSINEKFNVTEADCSEIRRGKKII